MVSITVPASVTSSGGANGVFTTTNVAQTTYVFDAILDLDHDQQLRPTLHPVQSGADISSHAYLEPAKLILNIGMSDVMAAYTVMQQSGSNFTPFTGNQSKSVSAYQQLLSFMTNRVLLNITTRLRNYTNMILISLPPHEDHRTITGLRVRVTFQQIILGSVNEAQVSARTQDTGTTSLGQINTQTPDQATLNQFLVQSATNLQPINVPGSGSVSSVNVNNLQQLPGAVKP